MSEEERLRVLIDGFDERLTRLEDEREQAKITWRWLNPPTHFGSTLKHKHTITVKDMEKEYGLEKRIQKTKKSFIEAWEEHFCKELTDQINRDAEKKIAEDRRKRDE